MSCHGDPVLSEGVLFLFGGTVYAEDGLGAAAGIEVGVSDGNGSYYAYSATNGNFWVMDEGTPIDWPRSDVRLRSARGQSVQLEVDEQMSGECAECHYLGGPTTRLTAP
jgi:hypothetical protein